MSFLSFDFVVLATVVLTLLALIKNPLARKYIILGVSCIFYSWWDWRFFCILSISTLVNYLISRKLVNAGIRCKQKQILWLGVIINLVILCIFKYSGYFAGKLTRLTDVWGWHSDSLKLLVPIGISFYVFESISYMIDVYREVTPPAKSFLDYAIFLTFFPRLVSGPIMRPAQFLPQLERGIQVNFPNLVEGMQLFLRGIIKKLVIADNIAVMVDQIYSAPSVFSSPTIWLGVTAYSIQILCDFWGYTDMALGIAKAIGIEMPQNFNLPYTAQTITEFWMRWHISLSTWFRDYFFLPLAYLLSKKMEKQRYLIIKADLIIFTIAAIITFLLTGLWHGVGWNFFIWGGIFGVFLVFERIIFRTKLPRHPWTSPKAWLRSSLVFFIMTLIWIIFRSPDWQTTLLIYKKMLFFDVGYNLDWFYIWALISIPLVIVGGWFMRRYNWKWPVLTIENIYTPAFLLFEVLVIYFFAPLNTSPFIYFQF